MGKKEGGWPGGGSGHGQPSKGHMSYSKFCMNESLEMVINDPESNLVITGIMIRYLDESPHEFIKKHQMSQKAQTGWTSSDSDATGQHMRPRDHGVVDDSLSTRTTWDKFFGGLFPARDA